MRILLIVLNKHNNLKIKRLAVSLILIILVVVVSSCAQTGKVDKVDSDSPTIKTAEEVIPPNQYNEDSIVALYEKSIQAVVTLIVETEINGSFGFVTPQEGQGSGFIINDQGHIITNNHVVEDSTKITVILHDDRRLEAEVVGTDRESDIALLQIKTETLGKIEPLLLGDSDNIKPGQMAIALGSPFGLDGSITIGIISGVGRSLGSASQRPNPEIIQTDAAINPGNSGGPLLNSIGKVIGINTAIEVSSTGIGFVVPINTVKSLLPELLKGGEVKNPWLGIGAVAINPNLSALLELPLSSGIYVVNITADSPAEQAGLIESGNDDLGQPNPGGDIITHIDRIEVSTVDDLVAYLNDKAPGDKIILSIQRGSDDFIIEVTLGEWPEDS